MATFTDWIETELKRRDWRPADLAQRAGITDATISRILNGQRQAGPDVCMAIADAFGASDIEVFRRRGWIRETMHEAMARDPYLEELYAVYRKIPPVDRPYAVRLLQAFSLTAQGIERRSFEETRPTPEAPERREGLEERDEMMAKINALAKLASAEQLDNAVRLFKKQWGRRSTDHETDNPMLDDLLLEYAEDCPGDDAETASAPVEVSVGCDI